MRLTGRLTIPSSNITGETGKRDNFKEVSMNNTLYRLLVFV